MEAVHADNEAALLVKQDFPEVLPPKLAAELTPLRSLVHHAGAVEWDLPNEEVERRFREKQVEYMALCRDEKVTGICARVRLGAMLGSRFGFALYGKSPAYLAQVDHPLVFSELDDVREVLDSALARSGSEFHEDVALVDTQHRLLGLIPVSALAQLQSRIVDEQLEQLRAQAEALWRKRLGLFHAGLARRQAQSLYEGLFNNNAMGVALLGSQGTVQAHNARLLGLMGIEQGDGAVTSLPMLVEPSDSDRLHALLELTSRNKSNTPQAAQEFSFRVSGRGPRTIRITTGWIQETGQILAFLDDVTEQRALERSTARQEKQLVLDTLVGGIAHELNNKLMPMLAYSDFLGNGADSETREMARLVKQSANEAAGIIRQLLQLSKPDSGIPCRFDFGAMVEETLVMLKFQIREHKAQLRMHVQPERVFVMADAAKMKQVVVNLVLNALQAMDATVARVLTIDIRKNGESAVLSVSDNGCGIKAEHLGRIFDPFFTTKGPDRGTGLGLSICNSVVRQFGGEISVESQQGSGATFRVELPCAVGPVEPAAEGPNLRAKVRMEKKARILVADDEEVVRILLQRLLRTSFGSEVDLASNGADALALASSKPYDLVISDIQMPVMGGTEFYRKLVEARPSLARAFVFITGHPGGGDLKEEISEWNVSVLAKPFTLTALADVCTPILSRQSAA